MGKYEKLVNLILSGKSDANIAFNELCNLMLKLGFQVRTRGSHKIYRKSGIQDLVNLQREGSKAKVYQVRKVRETILKYNLKLNGDA